MTKTIIENKKFGCWLIDNIKFDGTSFYKQLSFEGKDIELLVTNFEGTNELAAPFQDLIRGHIYTFGMKRADIAPLPIDSIYVVINSGYDLDDSFRFTWLFNLCLRLVYFKPTLISSTAELFSDGSCALPNWDGFNSQRISASSTINADTFDQVLSYFNLLVPIHKDRLIILEEIYKITGIGEVLIELLALYSFIEGFWNINQIHKSSLEASFNIMLGVDFAPGKENRLERGNIRKMIEEQNGLLRNNRLDDMRHILAHGMYKRLENDWNAEQWQAIYHQRELITSVVTRALVNKIAKTG